MELLCCYSVSYVLAYISGPPTFQPFVPVHYVIVGHSFVLNCTATNDPQSPNKLTFRWFKDVERRRINNKRNQWNITELFDIAEIVTSQLVISDLQVTKHNGTYICGTDNNKKRSYVEQDTVLIVESKFINMSCHLSLYSVFLF